MDLIIGKGLIGRSLYYLIRDRARLLSRKELDLSSDDWEIPKCETAYICAAVTSTKECADNPEYTRRVNVVGTVELVKRLGCPVVWISSERVFDGSVPFRKVTDEVCPTTEYGRQKAEAEGILLDMGCSVVRFSKVIGWDMPLFEGWRDYLLNGDIIQPYSNMGMSPLPVSFAAEFLQKIGEMCIPGLYQVSALYDLSYDRIARHIANYTGVDADLVRPIESIESHPHTTLDDNGITQMLGMDIPDAWDTIYRWCGDRCGLTM